MKSLLANAFFLAGAGSLVYGLVHVHPAAPWLAGGGILLTCAMGILKQPAKPARNTPQ